MYIIKHFIIFKIKEFKCRSCNVISDSGVKDSVDIFMIYVNETKQMTCNVSPSPCGANQYYYSA